MEPTTSSSNAPGVRSTFLTVICVLTFIGSGDSGVAVPLQNIMPKMSAVLYKVDCDNWNVAALKNLASKMGVHGKVGVNQRHKVALFVTRTTESIDWGNVRDLANTIWHLFLVHWDAQRSILFIHTSDKDASLDGMAEAIGGKSAQLIRGEPVFRTLHGLKRVTLMNLGLRHSVSRAIRFTMFVGADILEALSQAHQAGRLKSNTFGRGYRNGERASIGCSHRGRIWSYQIAADISKWRKWCHTVADQVLDESISFDDDILPYLLKLKEVLSRPGRVPILVEWWEDLLKRSEEYVSITFGDNIIPFIDVGLDIVNQSTTGNLSFRVFCEEGSATYEVVFANDKVEYRPCDVDLDINFGKKRSLSLSAYFQVEPLLFRFDDGSVLVYNRYGIENSANIPPYDANRLSAWKWDGVDIKVESQRRQKRQQSIQYRVIRTILDPSWSFNYDFVIDDDSANEAADIVAIQVDGEDLLIHLFHCKFSSKPTPGSRLDDLYEVCGQAQRCARWKHDVERLVHRLLIRDARQVAKNGQSRFEKGSKQALTGLRHRSRVLRARLSVFIVQPGLSKNLISDGQRDLLATTELYLKDLSQAELHVICSE